MKSELATSIPMNCGYDKQRRIVEEVYGLHLHHIAAKAGYVSRKLEYIREEYYGRFGEGYVLLRPRWDTKRYVYCEYWVK